VAEKGIATIELDGQETTEDNMDNARGGSTRVMALRYLLGISRVGTREQAKIALKMSAP
jgi:hypothetical protein